MKQGKRVMVGACLLVALCACAFLAGCMGPPDGPGPGPTTEPTTVTPTEIPSNEVASVVEANNMLAFDLYSKLVGEAPNEDTNIFFSPFSISSAFAITYEGARGTTADEIQSVFHFPGSMEAQRNGYKEVNSGINAGDPAYDLRVANALWAEETYPFLEDYIRAAEEYYSANTTNLDFINQPEQSRLTINAWAEEKTNEKITNLIPEGVINPLTRLVITNAIYFKGTWVKQFDEEKTYETDFTTASGAKVPVRMMQRTDEDAIFGYAETDTLQALRMPYEHESGKELSMMVLLPKQGDLHAVETALDAAMLKGLGDSMELQEVKVYFPRFKCETQYSLSDTLRAMGMPTAFSGGAADFSGMDGTKNLFISDVVHKAYVEVNEEGTEAAAATAVVMELSAIEEEPVPVFRADHPFIFLIQDDDTGNILFIGSISNPKEA
jgi:serine protease inhibitor